MIVCPICEHRQEAGSECEVCGRHLAAGRGTDAPVAPLEGLEPTGLGATAPPAAGSLLEGLEPTLFERAEEPLLAEVVADLEQTRAEPVEVAPDATPDVEHLLAGLPDDGPTLLPIVVVCRYCRTEAGPGERICARCGMRLPIPAAAPSAAGAALDHRCSCGVRVTGSLCPSCGARNHVA